MKPPLSSEWKARLPLPLPPFNILIVDDDTKFVESLSITIAEFAGGYYRLHIATAESVEQGMVHLRDAMHTKRPFDVVLLDYILPERPLATLIKDLSLARFCTQNRNACHWVAQLTSWASDPELIRLWSDFNLTELSIRLLQKSPDNLNNLLKAIFFREITIPLKSTWLPAELGLVETVMGRRGGAPRGFDIYRFVHRMGEVWPRLDDEIRCRAKELFSIEPGAKEVDRPQRIGFKSFTHRPVLP